MRLDWLVGRAKVDVLLPKRSFDERTFRYRDKSVASATTFSQHTVIIRAKATNVTYVIWNCTPQIAIFVWLVSHINWQIQSIVTMSTTTPRHCSGLLPDRPAGSRGHVQCSGWRLFPFGRIKSNSHHVLQPYLPDDNEIPYQLRARSHTLALINKTKFLNDATSSIAYCTSTPTDP